MSNTKNKYQLENSISELIFKDNKCSTHFEYIQPCYQQSGYKLNIITFNQQHNQHFLLRSTEGESFLECLEKAYQYVNKVCKKEVKINSYTVSWVSNDDNVNTTNSYFYGDNIEEVLEKFYFNKKKEDFIIHSINLNPIS